MDKNNKDKSKQSIIVISDNDQFFSSIKTMEMDRVKSSSEPNIYLPIKAALDYFKRVIIKKSKIVALVDISESFKEIEILIVKLTYMKCANKISVYLAVDFIDDEVIQLLETYAILERAYLKPILTDAYCDMVYVE